MATLYKGTFYMNLFREDSMYDRFVWNRTDFTSNTLENVSVGTIGTNGFTATIPETLRATLDALNTSIFSVYYTSSETGGGIDTINNKLGLGTAQTVIDTIYMDMAEDTSSAGTDILISGFHLTFLVGTLSLTSIVIALKRKNKLKKA